MTTLFFICVVGYAIIDTIQKEMRGENKKKKKRSKAPFVIGGLLGLWSGFCDYVNKRK